ncbi:DUF551 domain-containing protein [Escherichia coli]|nr:DUF551 domain-containing protein [Escherichia coli]EKB3885476.1 DUF551 domain-containing protein [Escherichia coli]
MTTVTDKELIKEIKERIGSLDVRDNIERRAYEIALASLEADPVAYIFKHPAGKLFWALTDESNKEQSDVIPVYAAPPVPVAPEEKPMPNPLKMYAVDAVAAIAEVRGWNACRAAMRKAGNSPVTPDGWISCSERMPDDKQYVWFFGEARGFAGRDTFEGYYDWSRNKWWAVTDIGEEPASKVTHWMPLPEPPQEVK